MEHRVVYQRSGWQREQIKRYKRVTYADRFIEKLLRGRFDLAPLVCIELQQRPTGTRSWRLLEKVR